MCKHYHLYFTDSPHRDCWGGGRISCECYHNIFYCPTISDRIIPLALEKTAIRHILLATFVMTASLLILEMFPLHQSMFQTILMVLSGAVIYFLVLLKLNKQIRDDAFRTLKNYLDTKMKISITNRKRIAMRPHSRHTVIKLIIPYRIQKLRYPLLRLMGAVIP